MPIAEIPFLSLEKIKNLLIDNSFAFVFGSVATLVTTRLARQARIILKHRSLLNLEGDWLEVIPDLRRDKRQYSVGTFYFDRASNQFRYDGTNYLIGAGTCKSFYRWECKVLHGVLDNDEKKILYVYKVYYLDSRTSEKYGFGVTYLNTRQEICTFDHGFFIDATENQKTTSRSFTSHSFKSLEEEFGISRQQYKNDKEFHKRILLSYHAKYG
jgi:hypothetical protein